MNSAHNNSSPVMQAVKSVENHLCQQGSKLPQETQNAMMWGALMVALRCGEIDWNEACRMYGNFVGMKMSLR